MDTKEVKEYYNSSIKNNQKYEEKRWFRNEIQKAGYDMTLATIKRAIQNENFSSCFELGPGHGTWTKELVKRNPDSIFNLLDISAEMLKLVRERFKTNERIEYIESDFLDFEPKREYDFFFSSRAIEYIPNKEEVAKKIHKILKQNGTGVVITKTPKYLRSKILRRKISDFHSTQVSPRKFRKILLDNNFENIEIYPTTLSFPIFRSAFLNKILYKTLGNLKLNCLSQLFSESYCVKFTKK